MIGRDTSGAIRALFEGRRKKREIARELDLDVKTVRKYLNQTWTPQRREPRGRLLDDFWEFIRSRAPEVGYNGEVLLRKLRGRGYEGSYSTLAYYIAPHRQSWRGEPQATLRFETGPGEQAQVDWGSTKVWLGEEFVRVHIFTMILGLAGGPTPGHTWARGWSTCWTGTRAPSRTSAAARRRSCTSMWRAT